MSTRPVLFTVGHSNLDLDDFLDLLSAAEVQTIADVRSAPDRVYREHFASAPLRTALSGAGIAYVFLGDGLGGRPRKAHHHDDLGRARYDLMAQEPAFLQALDQLVVAARRHRVVLLCSEENPIECHRRLLVGRALMDRGVDLRHLRADGSLVDENELAVVDGQDGLFDDLEVRPWRSARSVPRSGAPSPSSEH